MGMLEDKDWKAQAFYNEFLEIKYELLSLSYLIDVHSQRAGNENVTRRLTELKEEYERRLDVVLEHLELCGVSMKDLVKLACNVEI